MEEIAMRGWLVVVALLGMLNLAGVDTDMAKAATADREKADTYVSTAQKSLADCVQKAQTYFKAHPDVHVSRFCESEKVDLERMKIWQGQAMEWERKSAFIK
jgi:hypothetical protein